jgi:hypothetical protein
MSGFSIVACLSMVIYLCCLFCFVDTELLDVILKTLEVTIKLAELFVYLQISMIVHPASTCVQDMEILDFTFAISHLQREIAF